METPKPAEAPKEAMLPPEKVITTVDRVILTHLEKVDPNDPKRPDHFREWKDALERIYKPILPPDRLSPWHDTAEKMRLELIDVQKDLTDNLTRIITSADSLDAGLSGKSKDQVTLDGAKDVANKWDLQMDSKDGKVDMGLKKKIALQIQDLSEYERLAFVSVSKSVVPTTARSKMRSIDDSGNRRELNRWQKEIKEQGKKDTPDARTRRALGLEEKDAAVWKKTFDMIMSLPPAVPADPALPLKDHDRQLKSRWLRLVRDRNAILDHTYADNPNHRGLLLILSPREGDKPDLDAGEKQATLVRVAGYMREMQDFQRAIKIPETPIPDFLKSFLPLTPAESMGVDLASARTSIMYSALRKENRIFPSKDDNRMPSESSRWCTALMENAVRRGLTLGQLGITAIDGIDPQTKQDTEKRAGSASVDVDAFLKDAGPELFKENPERARTAARMLREYLMYKLRAGKAYYLKRFDGSDDTKQLKNLRITDIVQRINGPNVSEPLQQFSSEIVRGTRSLLQHPPDFKKIFAETAAKSKETSKETVAIVLEPLFQQAGKGDLTPEQKQRSAERIAARLQGSADRVKDMMGNGWATGQLDEFEVEVARKISEFVCTPEMVQKTLNELFLSNDSEIGDSSLRKQLEPALKELLEGQKISVSDAMHLYMLEQSSELSLPAKQAVILGIVERQFGDLSKERQDDLESPAKISAKLEWHLAKGYIKAAKDSDVRDDLTKNLKLGTDGQELLDDIMEKMKDNLVDGFEHWWEFLKNMLYLNERWMQASLLGAALAAWGAVYKYKEWGGSNAAHRMLATYTGTPDEASRKFLDDPNNKHWLLEDPEKPKSKPASKEVMEQRRATLVKFFEFLQIAEINIHAAQSEVRMRHNVPVVGRVAKWWYGRRGKYLTPPGRIAQGLEGKSLADFVNALAEHSGMKKGPTDGRERLRVHLETLSSFALGSPGGEAIIEEAMEKNGWQRGEIKTEMETVKKEYAARQNGEAVEQLRTEYVERLTGATEATQHEIDELRKRLYDAGGHHLNEDVKQRLTERAMDLMRDGRVRSFEFKRGNETIKCEMNRVNGQLVVRGEGWTSTYDSTGKEISTTGNAPEKIDVTVLDQMQKLNNLPPAEQQSKFNAQIPPAPPAVEPARVNEIVNEIKAVGTGSNIDNVLEKIEVLERLEVPGMERESPEARRARRLRLASEVLDRSGARTFEARMKMLFEGTGLPAHLTPAEARALVEEVRSTPNEHFDARANVRDLREKAYERIRTRVRVRP